MNQASGEPNGELPIFGSAFIAGYVRAPFTFAKKVALASVRPDELGAPCDPLAARTHRRPGRGRRGHDVGLRLSGGGAGAQYWPRRQTSLPIAAELGARDRGRSSSIQAIRVPMMGFNIIPLPSWSLDEVLDFVNVELAERIPERFGLPRKEQERFAYKSLAKAMKAQQAGKLADEIAPVKGGNALVAVNGRVRETPPQQLVDLKLPFRADGTVTAGTSSPLTDGATAVFVCSESYVEERGFAPLARTRSFAMSGRALSVMDLGSIGSSCELLARAKLTMDDIDIVEIIEAFVPPRPRDPRGEGHHRRRRDRARPSARRARRRLVGKVSPLLKLEKDAMRWATQCMGGGMGIAMELVAV